ncbi:Protein of unknown function DUF789 like protein [Aduncisulcus paluster]|uniref:Uncharacterized protein n=1 Tax=Aduncisulcus paluster TaxID=2918883 RepID=A0ABQ5KXE4_9EUKA|nr:Protein of unknown function DUF789 like protein [Aduncisulcus paluster]
MSSNRFTRATQAPIQGINFFTLAGKPQCLRAYNLDVFSVCAAPDVPCYEVSSAKMEIKDEKDKQNNIVYNLASVWRFFDAPFGLPTRVIIDNLKYTSFYTPYLSVIELYSKPTYKTVIDPITSKSMEEIIPGKLLLKFDEERAPSIRPPLINMIQELHKKNPILCTLTSNDIDIKTSWFAVTWYPIKIDTRTRAFLNGFFITYHQFRVRKPDGYVCSPEERIQAEKDLLWAKTGFSPDVSTFIPKGYGAFGPHLHYSPSSPGQTMSSALEKHHDIVRHFLLMSKGIDVHDCVCQKCEDLESATDPGEKLRESGSTKDEKHESIFGLKEVGKSSTGEMHPISVQTSPNPSSLSVRQDSPEMREISSRSAKEELLSIDLSFCRDSDVHVRKLSSLPLSFYVECAKHIQDSKKKDVCEKDLKIDLDEKEAEHSVSNENGVSRSPSFQDFETAKQESPRHTCSNSLHVSEDLLSLLSLLENPSHNPPSIPLDSNSKQSHEIKLDDFSVDGEKKGEESYDESYDYYYSEYSSSEQGGSISGVEKEGDKVSQAKCTSKGLEQRYSWECLITGWKTGSCSQKEKETKESGLGTKDQVKKDRFRSKESILRLDPVNNNSSDSEEHEENDDCESIECSEQGSDRIDIESEDDRVSHTPSPSRHCLVPDTLSKNAAHCDGLIECSGECADEIESPCFESVYLCHHHHPRSHHLLPSPTTAPISSLPNLLSLVHLESISETNLWNCLEYYCTARGPSRAPELPLFGCLPCCMEGQEAIWFGSGDEEVTRAVKNYIQPILQFMVTSGKAHNDYKYAVRKTLLLQDLLEFMFDHM